MRTELAAFIKKELRQTFRDKRMAAMLVIAPVLQLSLLGFAVDLDVEHVRTAVVDQDRTPASRRLVDGLLADATLDRELDTDDPEAPLVRGDVHVVVVLPQGLSADLLDGKPTAIQVLIDGTDPIRAQAALAACTQYLQKQSLTISSEMLRTASGLAEMERSLPRIEMQPRVLYNPRLKSPVYMVPGVAAVVLLVVTTVVTAMSIARERELGTIEQLLVTPVRPIVLLLGKVLPFAAIGLVTAGLVVSVGTNLFHVPVRGSLLVIFVGTVLYLMSTLGMGVFISTISRTQQQAILGSFFFILPAILVSGFMSPVDNMPRWVQYISWVDPVRYYVEILRNCLLKAATFRDLAPQMLALAVFGASILTLGALRFRKRLA